MRGSLLALRGVVAADVDWQRGDARVFYDPGQIGPEEIVAAVPRPYGARLVRDVSPEPK